MAAPPRTGHFLSDPVHGRQPREGVPIIVPISQMQTVRQTNSLACLRPHGWCAQARGLDTADRPRGPVLCCTAGRLCPSPGVRAPLPRWAAWRRRSASSELPRGGAGAPPSFFRGKARPRTPRPPDTQAPASARTACLLLPSLEHLLSVSFLLRCTGRGRAPLSSGGEGGCPCLVPRFTGVHSRSFC